MSAVLEAIERKEIAQAELSDRAWTHFGEQVIADLDNPLSRAETAQEIGEHIEYVVVDALLHMFAKPVSDKEIGAYFRHYVFDPALKKTVEARIEKANDARFERDYRE